MLVEGRESRRDGRRSAGPISSPRITSRVFSVISRVLTVTLPRVEPMLRATSTSALPDSAGALRTRFAALFLAAVLRLPRLAVADFSAVALLLRFLVAISCLQGTA